MGEKIIDTFFIVVAYAAMIGGLVMSIVGKEWGLTAILGLMMAFLTIVGIVVLIGKRKQSKNG